MLTNRYSKMGAVAGRILAAVPMLAFMVMIFMFSQANGEVSSGMSGRICSCIAQAWNRIFHLGWDATEEASFASGITYLIRKAAHVTEYLLLTLSYLLCFRFSFRLAWRRIWWMAGAATFVYACSDELHQRMIADRSGRFTDVLIDCIGAVIAIGLVAMIRRIRSRQNEKARCTERKES